MKFFYNEKPNARCEAGGCTNRHIPMHAPVVVREIEVGSCTGSVQNEIYKKVQRICASCYVEETLPHVDENPLSF